MQQDVLLVGSIPLDTPEQVFREFGGPLGSALKTMPDGEVGPRKHWISRIHYQVLSGHAELETVRRPAPENGVERLFPRNAADSWLFKVKDGVERVRFGDVGLADRLCARRHQLLFRVQDAARARRAAKAPALPGVACLGQQRAAAADFSRT